MDVWSDAISGCAALIGAAAGLCRSGHGSSLQEAVLQRVWMLQARWPPRGKGSRRAPGWTSQSGALSGTQAACAAKDGGHACPACPAWVFCACTEIAAVSVPCAWG